MKFKLTETEMATLRTGTLMERIRVFRNASGLGLKQSKDACEAIMSGRMKIEEFFTPKSPCLSCQGTGFVAEKAVSSVEVVKPIEGILEAAQKVNHDEFCGCASMAYPDGSSGPGIIDCPLGALLKSITNYKAR